MVEGGPRILRLACKHTVETRHAKVRKRGAEARCVECFLIGRVKAPPHKTYYLAEIDGKVYPVTADGYLPGKYGHVKADVWHAVWAPNREEARRLFKLGEVAISWGRNYNTGRPEFLDTALTSG